MGSLGVVAGLAAVTGCLDAVSLARLTGTFVAFQTGNSVLVGLDIGQGHLATSAPPLVAVLAYLVGSALAPTVAGHGRIPAARVARRLLAAAIGLLLVEVLLVLIGVGFGTDAARPSGALRYACIVVAAIAMAFQTPVVRRVNGVAVSSTFSTGMLARLGQSLGSWRDPRTRARERGIARVLSATIGAFLVGATIGGVMIEAVGNAAVVAPLVGLVTVAALVDRNERRGQGRGRELVRRIIGTVHRVVPNPGRAGE